MIDSSSRQNRHEVAVIEQVQDAARSPKPHPIAKKCARQGDLILRRIGDSDTLATGAATPASGITVQQGSHGEHRMVTYAYARITIPGQMIFDLPAGASVYHTDTPESRHGAIDLAPGRWECLIQQELDVAANVVQVRD